MAAGMSFLAGAKDARPALPEPKAQIAKAPGLGVFSRAIALRGTLGESLIQVRLRPKAEYEGVEGEYFRFGESAKILLAGEADDDEILLEESENGTDVSGHWEGKRRGNLMQGTWQSVDGVISKPFILTIIQDREAALPTPTGAVPARSKPAGRQGR